MLGGEQGGLCEMPISNRGFQVILFNQEAKPISGIRTNAQLWCVL